MVLIAVAAVATTQAAPSGQSAQAAAARSPRNANYTIQARLDPTAHRITGVAHLQWRNITAHPVTELHFHLYWNAWRDTESSWMRERLLSGNAALGLRPIEDRSAITLGSMSIAGHPLSTRFISPDDGNVDDATVVAVTLETPVAPGETATVDYDWTAHVPRPYARTGVIGNFYFIGQWFPKIGVLEESGWNCHQFHSATEFFSDFGVYDVSLTVPRGWVVGATGVEQSAEDTPDRSATTHRFVQEDVHDFAWTTSPDYLDLHQTFSEPGLPPVDMRLLLQPEHADQAERHFSATAIALGEYGHSYGAYPYGHITIVDPVANFESASRGENMGGMEYPTLFTAGSRWSVPWVGVVPESVTIHEAGHQFWYGIVANNEFERAWMDEGFNSFSQARAMDERLPDRFYAVDRYFGGTLAWPNYLVRWSRDIDGNRLNAYRPVASYDIPSTPTWQYWPGTASQITYNKTALWLATLERYLGWPTLQRIMSTYFARTAFQHPTPEQFFAIANEVSGQDLTWFFDAVYRSSATFDYGVAQVTSSIRPGASTTSVAYDDVVVVRRYGDGIFPTEIEITFADGSIVTEHWDGRDRWKAFTYRRPVKVALVRVDPRRVLLLDLNYTNNSWTSRPHAAQAAHKWSLRWLTWVEELMLSYGFFS